MRTLIWSTLLLAGCITNDMFDDDSDFDSGGPSSCLSVSPLIVAVPSTSEPGVFTVTNDCDQDVPVGFTLDADEGAFEVRAAEDATFLLPLGELQVEVWMVAAEPGFYEGQIRVSDAVLQVGSVQISGEILSEEE